MTEALKADAPVTIHGTSLARTLGAPFATERTLSATKQFVERIIVVDDGPVVNDLAWLLQTEKVLCEPAASCVLTAAQTICDTLPADAVLGLVLCGSNVALEDLDRWRQQFAA